MLRNSSAAVSRMMRRSHSPRGHAAGVIVSSKNACTNDRFHAVQLCETLASRAHACVDCTLRKRVVHSGLGVVHLSPRIDQSKSSVQLVLDMQT